MILFKSRIPEEDIFQLLLEVKQNAEVIGIPYNKLSPLNQFIVAIPPYMVYCLEKYLPDDPSLQEEVNNLLNASIFPRYLQDNFGIPISQDIKGAFWRPNPLGYLLRLFGLKRK